MFSLLVGNVDFSAAIVLIALFVGSGIVIAAFISTHKTKEDYEIEKMKQQNEFNAQLYSRETTRMSELKKIEQGQITSHRAE